MEFTATSSLRALAGFFFKRGAPKASPLFWFLVILLLPACSGDTGSRLLFKLPSGSGPTGLAISGKGDRLVVACKNGEVWDYNLSSEPPTYRVRHTGGRPLAVTLDNKNKRVFVADAAGPGILVMDLVSGRLGRRGSAPEGIRKLAWWPEGDLLIAVASSVAGVAFLDGRDLRLTKNVDLGGPGVDVRVLDDGRMLVLTRDSDSLSSLRLSDRRLMASGLTAPGGTGVALNADGKIAWVVCSGVTSSVKVAVKNSAVAIAFDVENTRAVDRFSIAELPVAVGVWDDHLVVAHGSDESVKIYNLPGGEPVKSIALGSMPSGLVVNEGGSFAYVSLPDENVVAVLKLVDPEFMPQEDSK